MLKKGLLGIVYGIKYKYDKYRIDELASVAGHTVLRLPPYHCELNPIELVWAQVKHHVAVRNTNFKSAYMQQLIEEGFNSVSIENWRNYVSHVKTVESDMWKADEWQDDIDPVIIPIGEDSSIESDMVEPASDNDAEG